MTHSSETVASWGAPDERADISREGVEKNREESGSKAARLQPHVSRLRYHILHTTVSMTGESLPMIILNQLFKKGIQLAYAIMFNICTN